MPTLLGLEGIAPLDAWAGDHDRAFTDARLAEIRRLLDDDELCGRGVLAERVSTVAAYRRWSASYDAEAAGGLFAMDEPVVAGLHVPLQPVFAEFAWVLRPGGDLVISDMHYEQVTRGSVISERGPAANRASQPPTAICSATTCGPR